MTKHICILSVALACLITTTGCQKMAFWKRGSGDQPMARTSAGGFSADRTAPTEEQRVNFMLEMANMFERQGDTDQALHAYKAVLAEEERPAALHRVAILLVKQGKVDEAIDYYNRALQLGGENADVLCDLGYSLYLAQRFEEADATLRRAIELRPLDKRGHANLGMVFARTGRYDDALVAFSHAGLSESEARNNLAFAMLVDQRLDEAQHQYELALQVDPTSATARRGLATLSHAQQRVANSGVPQQEVSSLTQRHEAAPVSALQPASFQAAVPPASATLR